MQAAEQLEELGPSFEQRYYAKLRRQTLAPEIGRTGLIGYEKRRQDEIASGLAEALEGIIKTDYPFELSEGKLIAADGELIEDILLRGLGSRIELASYDKFYEPFLVARTRHELNELREQEAMARGERPFNTIVTFSPYSEEYSGTEIANQKLVAAGQKPDWQRGMLRVSHWDGSLLYISNRSIDNSSVSLFKEAAKKTLGYSFEADNSTDMLGERIYLRLNIVSGGLLADKLTQAADELLMETRGGNWKQGRSVENATDLQTYVESQSDILDELATAELRIATQSLNFEEYQKVWDQTLYEYVALLESGGAMPDEDIDQAAASAGAEAAAEGRVYDMCGHVLHSDSPEAEVAHRTGFESVWYLLGKEFDSKFCPNCLPEPKSGKKIRAWRKGDEIGCKNCSHVINICTKKVVRQGSKQKSKAKVGLW